MADNEHNIVKSVTNPLCKSVLERLGSRFTSALKDFKETPAHIECKSCKVNIEKNESLLRQHILSDEHKKMSGFVMKRMLYNCEVCNTFYNRANTWDLHLINSLHVAR